MLARSSARFHGHTQHNPPQRRFAYGRCVSMLRPRCSTVMSLSSSTSQVTSSILQARTLLTKAPCRNRQRRLCEATIDARQGSRLLVYAFVENSSDVAEQPAAFQPGDRIREAVGECVAVVRSGGKKFIPMIVLFFSMAFINTLLDNLKDTLIFTQAVGGGAHVVPWLQVYGVFPCSLVFLTLFNQMAAHLTRRQMFNIIIACFMSFIGLFSTALFPNTALIHPTAFCEQLQRQLPSGFAGSVAVINNWSYSLFYCFAELWGDVCLSLLFWSLANEITSLKDAAVIYPLFGIGANVAQVCAGQVLKAVGTGGSVAGYVQQMQALCTLVLALGGSVLLLHEVICRHIATSDVAQGARNKDTLIEGSKSAGAPTKDVRSITLKVVGSEAAAPMRSVKIQVQPRLDETPVGQDPTAASHNDVSDAAKASCTDGETKKKKAMSFKEAIRYCWTNASIRCLAIMGIAQGLASNTLEYAWKLHLSQLCPTSQEFTSFLGDVASYTGVVTVMMMLVAPTCFKLLGWRKTARATPNFLLYSGVPFFVLCIAYQVMVKMAQFDHLARPMLCTLAVLGAALYVLTRSAKFSLFKPAEELIYIGLDEKARTSGKAAVDVLGAQMGKSTGALMQQVLLVATAASALHSLPVMGLIFMSVSLSWGSSVDQLSLLVKPHTSLESCNSQDRPLEKESEVFGCDGPGDGAGDGVDDTTQRYPAVASA